MKCSSHGLPSPADAISSPMESQYYTTIKLQYTCRLGWISLHSPPQSVWLAWSGIRRVEDAALREGLKTNNFQSRRVVARNSGGQARSSKRNCNEEYHISEYSHSPWCYYLRLPSLAYTTCFLCVLWMLVACVKKVKVESRKWRWVFGHASVSLEFERAFRLDNVALRTMRGADWV